MPRGIPKDPNHPRNKNKAVVAAPADAPKRRGRPPGSKNAAKNGTPSVKAVAKSPTKTIDNGPAISPKKIQATLHQEALGIGRFQGHPVGMSEVRANLTVLAQLNPTQNDVVARELAVQLGYLHQLTVDLINPTADKPADEEVEEVVEQAPVVAQPTQSAPAPLPPVPNFMMPPFPTPHS